VEVAMENVVAERLEVEKEEEDEEEEGEVMS